MSKKLAIIVTHDTTPNVHHLSMVRFDYWSDAVSFLRNGLKNEFAKHCEEIGEYVPGFTCEVVGATHLRWREQW